jgi:hypothetical protein
MLGLWCLTPHATIFLLFRGVLIYWWKEPEYPEKTNDPDKLYHIKLYRVNLSIRTHILSGDRH